MGGEKAGESFSGQAPERRSLPRYSVDEDSILYLVGYGVPVRGCIENLSLSGCRVRSRERISAPAGSRIEISFKVNGAAFRFSGILVWTDGRNLGGIRFVDMIPRRRAELAAIIGEMEAVTAARGEAVDMVLASQEALQPDTSGGGERTPEQRPTRTENGTGKSTAPAEGAPANRAATGAKTGPGTGPGDRRTCSRHAVDTSAVILLINVGSTLRGRILDLSQGGCRIRTDERFPVDIFTRVETEFCLQGLPLRLGGVIQAIHDRNTVGIRFLDLSDRKREQVAELIGEIQHIHAVQMAAEAAQAEEQPAADAS